MDKELTPYDQWLANLKPAGPVITMRIIDGRLAVFSDGEPAPDHPYQRAFDAQQAEIDKVMARVVQQEGVDEDHLGRQTWIVDTEKSANRAPFRPDDLVVRDGGYVNRVIEVVSGYTKTSWLGLRVKRADLVLDKDEF